jgi:ABC-type phosphate transport system substrate-binding protein
MKPLIVALTVLSAALVPAGEAQAQQQFVVVVNAANPTSELSRSDVSNAFLKKTSGLVAVDLDKGSAVRDAFSRSVHGRPVAAILAHWQQQIFSGRSVPPAERSSDADVLTFVRDNANAIGYVAMGTTVGPGVKAVQVK